jgi:hypothetical protein
MIPEPETLARMIAALCMLAVGSAIVAFVGWLLHL